MHNQKGMTIPSMLVVGLISLLLIKAAFAVVPMYWDDKMLSTVLNKMQSSPASQSINSPKQLKGLIEDRLSSNNLNISAKSGIIQPVKDRLVLDWKYESRGNWNTNNDIVRSFHHQAEF